HPELLPDAGDVLPERLDGGEDGIGGGLLGTGHRLEPLGFWGGLGMPVPGSASRGRNAFSRSIPSTSSRRPVALRFGFPGASRSASRLNSVCTASDIVMATLGTAGS